VCSHLAPAIPANGHRANFQTFRRRRHTEQYKQDQQCRQDNAEKGTPNRHRIPPRSGGWCGCVKLGSGARLRLEPDLHLASLPSLKNLGSKSRENRSKLLILLGALGEIRTPGPRNRNPMLYPAELRVQRRHHSGETDESQPLDGPLYPATATGTFMLLRWMVAPSLP
jgi:hypothetical protein